MSIVTDDQVARVPFLSFQDCVRRRRARTSEAATTSSGPHQEFYAQTKRTSKTKRRNKNKNRSNSGRERATSSDCDDNAPVRGEEKHTHKDGGAEDPLSEEGLVEIETHPETLEGDGRAHDHFGNPKPFRDYTGGFSEPAGKGGREGTQSGFEFVFKSPPSKMAAGDDTDHMDIGSSSPSPTKTSSPFEFVFSSPGGGRRDTQDQVPFEKTPKSKKGVGGASAQHSPSENTAGCRADDFACTGDENRFGSSHERAGAQGEDKVFDFVFCSPNGKQPGPLFELEDFYGKENSGTDPSFHLDCDDPQGMSSEEDWVAKDGVFERSKSNVDKLGETLSQKLAESLSGLFIDMPLSFDQYKTQFQAQGHQHDGHQPFAVPAFSPSQPQASAACKDLDQAHGYKESGNRAFSQALFREAIQSYTSCVNACFLITVQSVTLNESHDSKEAREPKNDVFKEALKVQADALSNRAAAHIMLNNASSALDDCEEALRIFPGHERAQVRHATCKMYMCDFKEARRLLLDCKEKKMKGRGLDADVREKLSVVEDILDLIHVKAKAFPMNKTKAEEVVKRVGSHLEYLPRSRDLTNAKCNVLLSLHRYSEVLGILSQLKGGPLLPTTTNPASCGPAFDAALVWLEALAHSGLGDLDKAIKIGETCCTGEDCAAHEAIGSRIVKWKKLVDLKREANQAFASGQNRKSQDLYTQAIKIAVSKNVVECPPFTAILYCNRSATYQKDLDVVSALVDCARACALDPTYAKAFTRGASICESVQLYPQALEFLKEALGHNGQGHSSASSSGVRMTKKEAKGIAHKVKRLEDLLLRETDDDYDDDCDFDFGSGPRLPLPNYYKVFSLDMSADYSDIKKTYHRVALKCHPDKDPLCAHVERTDKMNMVFSLIRQAYDALSDRQRRTQYDKRLLRQIRGQYAGGSPNNAFANNWRSNTRRGGGGSKRGGGHYNAHGYYCYETF